MKPEKTIKRYAEELFVRVDFVDCYGRPIGLDYDAILAAVRHEFPRSRTTKNALRYIYNNLDRSSIRLPARLRSRKIIVREYIRSLLLHEVAGRGLAYNDIRTRAWVKFPDTPPEVRSTRKVVSLEGQLRRQGFKVPPREH